MVFSSLWGTFREDGQCSHGAIVIDRPTKKERLRSVIYSDKAEESTLQGRCRTPGLIAVKECA